MEVIGQLSGVLSFTTFCFGDQIQVVRFGSKYLPSTTNHLVDPIIFLVPQYVIDLFYSLKKNQSLKVNKTQ